MPKLFIESALGKKDKSLRDYFYNGLLGKYYYFLMPFLTLPARPLNRSKKDWIIYTVTIFLFLFLIYKNIEIFTHIKAAVEFPELILTVLFVSSLAFILYFFIKQPHFFFLFILAIPVKISLNSKKYHPSKNFQEIHKKYIDLFISPGNKNLQVLDISTGTGNSLYRHGWMKLNAEYTGLDLSEVMLAQCQSFMASKTVPIDLVIGDATNLPFNDNYFDIVLNYGAVNGYSDIKQTLKEMNRVVKSDGLILFLDEQLYSGASAIEKFYFKKVLSSHNTIHHCPVELLPPDIGSVNVYQVYEFYYICTVQKNDL